jgi:histidinol-phosphate aminotransferase
MNRRVFVQTVGAGALGALAPFAHPLEAAQRAGSATRVAMPSLAAMVRIGSNENPYGPAAKALEAVRDAAAMGNRYPGPAVAKLVTTIAEKHNVPEDHVLLSGGSGDILRGAVNSFTGKLLPIVTGSPSYESPMRQAQHIGTPVKAIKVKPDMTLDLAAMSKAAAGAGILYMCNPNNPTSTAVPIDAVTMVIERLAKMSPKTLVLVDEAYFEYADLPTFGTAIPLALKYPSVLVARTFSKIHAMAGMRVGYAIAQPKVLNALRENHSPSGMSVMSLSAATASLEDGDSMEKNRSLNREVRKTVLDGFTAAGYEIAASDANFVFVNIKRESIGFQAACRDKGIAVGRVFPPLTNWARISIGTALEMTRAMEVFMEVLSAPPAPAPKESAAMLMELPSELT